MSNILNLLHKHRAITIVLTLAVSILILLHVATSFVNFFPLKVDSFLHQIAPHLHYQNAKVRWHWLGPEILLQQAQWYDDNDRQALFSARELKLAFDLFHSLLKQRFLPKKAFIANLELTFQQQKDGYWTLNDNDLKQWQKGAFDLQQLLQLDDKSVYLSDLTMSFKSLKQQFKLFAPSTRFNMQGDNQLFKLYLTQKNSVINWKIWSQPIEVRHLEMQIVLLKHHDKPLIVIPTFTVENKDLWLKGHAYIKDPLSAEVFVDTQIEVKAKHFTQLMHYLPVAIMPKKAIDWFTQAQIRAHEVSGRFHLQGYLKEFPFDTGHGWFETNLFIQGGEIHYAPGWPQAMDVDTNLMFRNRSMQLDIHKGKIADIPIQAVNIWLPRISTDTTDWLFIRGKAQADLQQGLQFIHQSSLEAHLGQGLKPVRANGDSKLNLNLIIPISRVPIPVQIKGSLQFPQALITVPDWEVALEQVKGTLNFTEKLFTAENIQGVFLEKPFMMQIKTLDAPKPVTQLTMNFSNDIKKLTDNWHLKLQPYVQGETEFNANINVPHDPRPDVEVDLRSSLKGIAINLPKPFMKTPQETWPVDINLQLNNPKQVQMSIKLTNLGQARLLFNKHNSILNWQSGILHLGPSSLLLQSPNVGLKIIGSMNELDVKFWKDFIKQKAKDNKFNQNENISSVEFDLFVRKLLAWGMVFENAHFKFKDEKSYQVVQLVKPDLNGTIKLPKKINQPILIDLKRLNLQSKQQSFSKNNQLTPDQLKPMRITVKNFAIDDKPLGELRIRTNSVGKKIKIDELVLRGNNMILNAVGDWSMNAHPGSTHTFLQGQLDIKKLATLLKNARLPEFADSRTGRIDFQLTWPGNPIDFQLARSSGKLTLKLQDGRINQLDPNTEAKLELGKLLSVLSLQTLPKLLTLQLGELLQSGFHFNEFFGEFRMMQGDAYVIRSLLQGDVADIRMKGRIGFGKRDYDLLLTVTPYITSSLPVAAAIAGGPVAGVATWVLDKMLSKSVNQITEYTYVMKGPWQQPTLQANVRKP